MLLSSLKKRVDCLERFKTSMTYLHNQTINMIRAQSDLHAKMLETEHQLVKTQRNLITKIGQLEKRIQTLEQKADWPANQHVQ
jgi:hypothetical protein